MQASLNRILLKGDSILQVTPCHFESIICKQISGIKDSVGFQFQRDNFASPITESKQLLSSGALKANGITYINDPC